MTLTVDSQVSQRRTGRPLHLCIMTAQQEEDRIQCIPANRTNFFLRNFRKGEGSASLQVYIIREGERRQCGERGSREEICCRPVCMIEIGLVGVNLASSLHTF